MIFCSMFWFRRSRQDTAIVQEACFFWSAVCGTALDVWIVAATEHAKQCRTPHSKKSRSFTRFHLFLFQQLHFSGVPPIIIRKYCSRDRPVRCGSGPSRGSFSEGGPPWARSCTSAICRIPWPTVTCKRCL